MSNSSTPEIPVATAQSAANIPEGAIKVQASSTSGYSQFNKDLQEGFNKDFLGQSARLLDTAKSLLTLQIAIPGLYAALLKMFSGDDATILQSDYLGALLIAGSFLFWLLGLGFSLFALKPDKYLVNPSVLSRTSVSEDAPDSTFSGLFEMYQNSASRKYTLVVFSSVLTMLGLILMVINLMIY